MAQITLTIPDDPVQQARIINALCDAGNLNQYHIDLGHTPDKTGAYARTQLINFVKQLVVQYEIKNAAPTDPDVT